MNNKSDTHDKEPNPDDLFKAIVQGNPIHASEIVDQLKPQDLNKISNSGELALGKALESDQLSVADKIMKELPNSVRTPDAYGNTASHEAESDRSKAFALSKGASKEKVNSQGEKPEQQSWLEKMRERDSQKNKDNGRGG
jgi:hypothetical protein